MQNCTNSHKPFREISSWNRIVVARTETAAVPENCICNPVTNLVNKMFMRVEKSGASELSFPSFRPCLRDCCAGVELPYGDVTLLFQLVFMMLFSLWLLGVTQRLVFLFFWTDEQCM